MVSAALAQGAGGETVYLTSDGNDASAARGERARAFASLTNAFAAVRDGDTLEIGPGVFTVSATFSAATNSGCGILFVNRHNIRIHGAGKEVTTLQLATAINDTYNVVIGGTGANSGLEVSALTVDCNYAAVSVAAPRAILDAVTLSGGENTIREVRAIHAGGTTGEAFVLGLGWDSAVSLRNLISHCEVVGGTGRMTAIALTNNDARHDYTIYSAGVVEDCVVTGAQIGYGGFAMGDAIFRRDVAVDCEYGMNVDSFHNRNVTVEDCRFLRCRLYGIVGASGTPQKDWTFRGNYIEVPGGGNGFILGGHANARLIGNRVARTGGAGGTLAKIGGECREVRLENNRAARGMRIADARGASGSTRDNRDETGALVLATHLKERNQTAKRRRPPGSR